MEEEMKKSEQKARREQEVAAKQKEELQVQKIKNIEDKIHKGKIKALYSSLQLSGNYEKELEAYVMEDKPR